MKFAVRMDIKGFIGRHKKLLVCFVGLVALAGCVVGGLRYYTIQRSPEKAVQTITLALQKGNRIALASLVDFRSLAENFSQHIVAAYGADTVPPLPDLADTIQQKVLESFDAKAAESGKPTKAALYAPLNPFPPDTLVQIGTTLEVQTIENNFALLRAKVDYPRAETAFTLVFQMDKSASDAWRISKIVNAAEMVQAFMAAEASIARQKADALAEKNAEQRKRMDAQLRIHSCTAVAGLLSDRQTALLTVEILGRNPGPHAVHNLNIEASLTGKKDPHAPSIFLLNLAKRTLQGEDFSHTWNIALDVQNPEHQYLLREKTLQCGVQFNNMGLSSGEVLFVRKNLQ